jgi:hypothetical protein
MEEVQVNHGHATERESRTYAKVHAIIKNPIPQRMAALIGDHAQNHAHTEDRREKA